MNPMVIGKDYVVPVSRGEIRWHTESWGAGVTERIYMDIGANIDQTIMLPWSTLELIMETANV